MTQANTTQTPVYAVKNGQIRVGNYTITASGDDEYPLAITSKSGHSLRCSADTHTMKSTRGMRINGTKIFKVVAVAKANAEAILNAPAPVPAPKNLTELAKLDGGQGWALENRIYGVMSQICNGYDGGSWNFTKVLGGGYMKLNGGENGEKLLISVPYGNDYTGEMSYDAASILANLLALNHNGNYTAYQALFDYACEHAEAGALLAAID